MLAISQFGDKPTVYDMFDSLESTIKCKTNELARYLTPPRATKIDLTTSLIPSDIGTVTPMDVSLFEESPTATSVTTCATLRTTKTSPSSSETNHNVDCKLDKNASIFSPFIPQLVSELQLAFSTSSIENILKNILYNLHSNKPPSRVSSKIPPELEKHLTSYETKLTSIDESLIKIIHQQNQALLHQNQITQNLLQATQNLILHQQNQSSPPTPTSSDSSRTKKKRSKSASANKTSSQWFDNRMKHHSSSSSSDESTVDSRTLPPILPTLDKSTYSPPSEIRNLKQSRLRKKYNNSKKRNKSPSVIFSSSPNDIQHKRTPSPLSYKILESDSEEYKIKNYLQLPILSDILLKVLDKESADTFSYHMPLLDDFMQLHIIDFIELFCNWINIPRRDEDLIKKLQHTVRAKDKTISTLKKLVLTKPSIDTSVESSTPVDKSSSVSTSSDQPHHLHRINSDSDSDDYPSKISSNKHEINPIINSTTVEHESRSTNEPDIDPFNHEFDDQYEQVFQDGVEQTLNQLGYFDDDFPRYTEKDMHETFQDGRELGIEETIDNQDCIERDRR